MKIDQERLYFFIAKALRKTYASLGVEKVSTNKYGFKELHFSEGELTYKDSYTGFYKSRGFEVVRYQNSPIWMCSYGGGMIKPEKTLAMETFTFLKKVFLADTHGFKTFRGPQMFTDQNWKYTYSQKGDVAEFQGYEEIHLNNELIFYHHIIGGEIQEM